MKKTLCTLLLLVAALAAQAQEETTKLSLLVRTNFELKTLYGLRQHHMQPMNLGMQLSYSFTDRLSMQVAAERNHTLLNMGGSKTYRDGTLLNMGGSKTYRDGTLLGGGMSYVWLKDRQYRYDARLQVLSTIGHPQLKQTSYDLGMTFYAKGKKRGLSPVIGIGFRYQKSHTAGIRDWCGFYATVGIRF